MKRRICRVKAKLDTRDSEDSSEEDSSSARSVQYSASSANEDAGEDGNISSIASEQDRGSLGAGQDSDGALPIGEDGDEEGYGAVNAGDDSDMALSDIRDDESGPSGADSNNQSGSSGDGLSDGSEAGDSYGEESDDSAAENAFIRGVKGGNYPVMPLRDSLQQWAMRGISKTKVTELLHLLEPLHPELPRDARTLLKTPRSTPSYVLGEGEMWYNGILSSLKMRLSEEYVQNHNSITIDVNTDGVNAFGFRCAAKFWPILGCLAGETEPFIIGCFFFCCKCKPADLQTFLGDFCAEVAVLSEDGFVLYGKHLTFSVRDYIMDAEARSFAKSIIKHNGREACEKCCTRGK